jgi:hypothetical protein
MPHIQVKREIEARRGSNNVNIRDPGQLNYKQRILNNHSPSNADLVGGVNGMPLGGGGYFQQRNQSMDVGTLATNKKPTIKAQIVQRKRNAIL